MLRTFSDWHVNTLLFGHYRLLPASSVASMMPPTPHINRQSAVQGNRGRAGEMGHLAVTAQTGGQTPQSRKQNSKSWTLTTHSPHDNYWLRKSQSVRFRLQEQRGEHRHSRCTRIIKSAYIHPVCANTTVESVILTNRNEFIPHWICSVTWEQHSCMIMFRQL